METKCLSSGVMVLGNSSRGDCGKSLPSATNTADGVAPLCHVINPFEQYMRKTDSVQQSAIGIALACRPHMLRRRARNTIEDLDERY